MNIRRAKPEDAHALAIVHVAAWQTAYPGIVPHEHINRITVERREPAFHKALTEGSEETYLAEQGDSLLGFVTLGQCRDRDRTGSSSGEIWGIYVTPNEWRKGVGAALVTFAEQLMASRCFDDVTLWVLAENTAARRFYVALGYVLDGVTKDVELGVSLACVRYWKQISKNRSTQFFE